MSNEPAVSEPISEHQDSPFPTVAIPFPSIETLESLLAALRRVVKDEEFALIEENGQPVAALISMKDFRFYEKLFKEKEDQIDNAAADAALAEMEATGEKGIPLEDLLREMGREDLIRKG